MDQTYLRNNVVSQFLGQDIFEVLESLRAGAQTEAKLVSRLQGYLHADQVRKTLKALEHRGVVHGDRSGDSIIWAIDKSFCTRLISGIVEYLDNISRESVYDDIVDQDIINILKTPKLFHSSERVSILALICHSERSATELIAALGTSASRGRVSCALNNFERAGLATSKIKRLSPDIKIPILRFSATNLGQRILPILEKRRKKFGM